MSEFEDRELRDRLGRISGAFPDANAAYADVVGKVAKARRRRAVVVSTSTTAVLIATFLLAVGLRGRGSETHSLSAVDTPPTTVEGGPTTSAAATTTTSSTTTTSTLSTTTSPSTTSVPATSVVPITANSSAPVLPPETVPSLTDPPTASTSTTKPRSAPTTSTPKRGTTPGHGTAGTTTSTTAPADTGVGTGSPDTEPPATETPTTEPATTEAPATYQTFSGVGGSITVRLEHGSMQVVNKAPNPEFGVYPRDLSGQHVEVRFYSSTHVTKINVDLVGGVMIAKSDEQDFTSGSSSAPPTSVADRPEDMPTTTIDNSGRGGSGGGSWSGSGGDWHGGPTPTG